MGARDSPRVLSDFAAGCWAGSPGADRCSPELAVLIDRARRCHDRPAFSSRIDDAAVRVPAAIAAARVHLIGAMADGAPLLHRAQVLVRVACWDAPRRAPCSYSPPLRCRPLQRVLARAWPGCRRPRTTTCRPPHARQLQCRETACQRSLSTACRDSPRVADLRSSCDSYGVRSKHGHRTPAEPTSRVP